MLEKLKKHYKNLFVKSEVDNSEQYRWFSNEVGEVFGIHSSVGEKELQLLSSLFQPIQIVQSNISKIEQIWHDILLGKENNFPFLPVRFIYFVLDKELDDVSSFREALEGIMMSEHSIIWMNSLEGVIVEKYTNKFVIEYDSLIDIMATDFYRNIRIYVGKVHRSKEEFYRGLEIEQKCIQFAKKMSGKTKLYTINELIPMILVREISSELKSPIWKEILKDTVEEPDLLETIILFLQNNLNVSQTAKSQYLHRNSVQYRVDKFIERTGIDVKTFDGAALVYLALLCRNDDLYTMHKS